MAKIRIEVPKNAMGTRIFVDDVEQRDLVAVKFELDARGPHPQRGVVELTHRVRGQIEIVGDVDVIEHGER